MKKITFLFFLLTVSLGYSQTVLEDFDGMTAPTFSPNNGLGSTAIVADPDNAANMVGQLISAAAGDPWQQADLIMQNNLIDLTTTTTVDVDVYSNTAINVLSRVDDNLLGTTGFATAEDQHTGTGWETLTFDFTGSPDGNGGNGAPNGEYSQISFFPSWVGGGAGNNGTNPNWNNPVDGITLLVDNITAIAGQSLPIETCSDGILNNGETEIDCGGPNCAACPAAPTVAAPDQPNRAPADVLSIFSSAYANIGVDTFDTPWCPGTTTEILIAGNATKQITGLGCEGIDWQSSRTVDASGFTFFHMDIWTDSDTMDKSFNIKFSNWGGTGGETSAIEFSLTNASSPALPNPNPGTWISLDIPLSSWTPVGSSDISDIVQFVITSDLGTVYYDNLYLHKNTTLGTDEFETAGFKVFPNPTNDVWNISSSNTISNVAVYDILGKQVLTLSPNSNEATINASSLRTGVYFARIEGVNGSKTIKLVRE